jgi:DNA-binding response OmpR family regulator
MNTGNPLFLSTSDRPGSVPKRPSALLVFKDGRAGRHLAENLAVQGFYVVLVESGLEAIKKLKTANKYRLMVAELLLDEFSGAALAIELKKTGPAYALGINNGNEQCRSAALEFGFDIIVENVLDAASLCRCFRR